MNVNDYEASGGLQLYLAGGQLRSLENGEGVRITFNGQTVGILISEAAFSQMAEAEAERNALNEAIVDSHPTARDIQEAR